MDGDLILGVDGGGTGCRARLYTTSGDVLAEAEGGPTNLLIGDGADSFANVVAAARSALKRAGLSERDLGRVRAGLGLAGATAEARARFFARKPPFAETRIVSDALAALLGAFGGGDGAAVIMGTGIVAYVLKNGETREIGGWGFFLDDFGSGADIGRRGLRAGLRLIDADKDGPLAEMVRARFGDPRSAMAWAAAARPTDFGTFAPKVFELAEAGDPAAAAIIARSEQEALRLIDLARRNGAARVAMFGSVAQRIAPRLGIAFAEPQDDATAGAALAVRLGMGWDRP